jgi:hypothetical protein
MEKHTSTSTAWCTKSPTTLTLGIGEGGVITESGYLKSPPLKTGMTTGSPLPKKD